ncbi:zinc/manganese transport system substrate-binding protein [Sphaerotilus hippei]|uniref:Zinc/manganese transport system substrate-binding protein n=1 Tax=Sphaerotilus hippei TaxID=744406 RepID=A0A318H529_9BURK|nr:zinc ABC transporter substrate-binding protein [Sphaerotilus hippei]PXW98843.1 zinc/manganese transport system substrate-binding protein [Sphaerotilus hippei]
MVGARWRSRRDCLIAAAAACGLGVAGAARAASPPLRVVATFSILADLARQVAPPDSEVHALVGPDADAHVFEPTPQDVMRLARADAVVVNGLFFEGWIDRLIRASGFRGPVIVASEGITPRRLGPSVDPHAWQDLAHVRRYLLNLQAGFARLRPESAALMQQRTRAYLAQVDALDRDTRARLATIPVADRRVVTTHDAFGYLARAQDIEFLAAQGWDTHSEASAADIARLIAQIRRQHARAVFIENISDPRLARRLAREAGATVGGTLYSDALSAPGTAADTFLKMYAHNVDMLVRALGGPPAAR